MPTQPASRILVFCLFLVTLATQVKAEQKAFKVCFETWEPYSYLNENGVPSGYSVEHFDLVMHQSGLTVSYHNVPYARCIKGIENGHYDAILMGNDFPEMIRPSSYSSGNWIISAIVKQSSAHHHFQSLEQFNDQRWASEIGYEYPELILEFKGWSKHSEVSVSSNIFQMLIRDRIDVYLEDELWARQEIANNNYPLKILQPPIVSIPQPAGFHQRHSELLALYDQNAINVEATEEFKALRKRYFSHF